MKYRKYESGSSVRSRSDVTSGQMLASSERPLAQEYASDLFTRALNGILGGGISQRGRTGANSAVPSGHRSLSSMAKEETYIDGVPFPNMRNMRKWWYKD